MLTACGRPGRAGRSWVAALQVLTFWFLWCTPSGAQDIEPGTYTNIPVGANALVVGIGRTTGEVVFDPTLPVEDAEADIYAVSLGYVRGLDVAGRSGRLELLVPYTWGSAEGLFEGDATKITRSGLADARVRFAVNLLGAPALAPRDFGSFRQGTIVGASVQVVVPVGQYDDSKRINLGSNRWAFRPEVGVSQAWGDWRLDLHGAVWLSTDNDRFLRTSVLSQEPLGAVQLHLTRTFASGVWISGGGTFFHGGQTEVDGQLRNDLQSNSRLGAGFSIPVGPHAIRVLYTSGLTTRIGGDFRTVGVAYQFNWF